MLKHIQSLESIALCLWPNTWFLRIGKSAAIKAGLVLELLGGNEEIWP